MIRAVHLQRRALTSAAVSVVALGLSACADSAKSTDKPQIARLIKLAFTTQDPKLTCEQLGSKGFIQRVYGDVAQCLKAEKPAPTDKPPTDVPVSDITVNGATATARARFVGGDTGGVAGSVRVRKEGGRWRIDDFGTDLLRSVFKLGLETELKKDKNFSAPSIRACVTKVIDDLPADHLKRFAYDAIGKRRGADTEFGRLLVPCLAPGVPGGGLGTGIQS